MMKRWLWMAALAFVGCTETATTGAPASLLDTEIPPDFTFNTARGLTVRAEGNPEVAAATLAEVRLPNGELVHQGPLSAPMELAVPGWAGAVHVTLRSPTGARTIEVPVVGAEATVQVE